MKSLATTRTLSAALLALPCVLVASYTQHADADEFRDAAGADPMAIGEPTERTSSEGPTTDRHPEPVGEAEQAWTKEDCYAAWKYNMQGCNSSPPNLRPACWAAASALLAACLAAAQG